MEAATALIERKSPATPTINARIMTELFRPAVMRIHGRLAIATNEHDGVRLPLARRNFHPRRTRGHSRTREAASLRSLAQQPLDVVDGHVPFHEVAVDFRRVTRAHSIRQS